MIYLQLRVSTADRFAKREADKPRAASLTAAKSGEDADLGVAAAFL